MTTAPINPNLTPPDPSSGNSVWDYLDDNPLSDITDPTAQSVSGLINSDDAQSVDNSNTSAQSNSEVLADEIKKETVASSLRKLRNLT